MGKQLRDGGPSAERRPVFMARTAVALACLLLASGAVCWVAANWEQATALQKLVGAQVLVAALALAAAWYAGPRQAGSIGGPAPGNHNFAPAAHLAGLAGVATGALLALVGQIYQTGADAWQLFLAWAALLVPWLLTLRTIFLGLLFALVLNTALALYLGVHDGRPGGTWGAGRAPPCWRPC